MSLWAEEEGVGDVADGGTVNEEAVADRSDSAGRLESREDPEGSVFASTIKVDLSEAVSLKNPKTFVLKA